MAVSHPTLKLFYCYAYEDRQLRDELDVHLYSLKRQQILSTWYDREIHPGVVWKQEIHKNLRSADLILLLISPHFLASEYCYGIEMKQAFERHNAGEARVLPVIIRPVHWQYAPFSVLQALPDNAKPVTSWENRDEAWLSVVKGILKVTDELSKTREEKGVYKEENIVPLLNPAQPALRGEHASSTHSAQVQILSELSDIPLKAEKEQPEAESRLEDNPQGIQGDHIIQRVITSFMSDTREFYSENIAGINFFPYLAIFSAIFVIALIINIVNFNNATIGAISGIIYSICLGILPFIVLALIIQGFVYLVNKIKNIW